MASSACQTVQVFSVVLCISPLERLSVVSQISHIKGDNKVWKTKVSESVFNWM